MNINWKWVLVDDANYASIVSLIEYLQVYKKQW